MKKKLLAILLIILIASLTVLDAPEYVRCTDVGICEFLEVYAHLGNNIRSDIQKGFIATLNQIKYQSLISIEETSKRSFVIYLMLYFLVLFKYLYILFNNQGNYIIHPSVFNINLPFIIVNSDNQTLRILSKIVIRS